MSFLTDYRPNFCSECGAKIVRLRWRVWTSRRFCDACFSRWGKTLRLQRVAIAIVLLLLGVLIGRGFRREPPPLVIHRPVSTQSPQTTQLAAPAVEETYICGARTRKGTPCSRRVRGPVRCWQHKGAKAMLPLEKLVVKE
ncbi:MAG TPA: hypothetical protein VK868_14220 [Pyrinomonadaceae bacterium]|nr:hypothetical protein [Pyrinomonadaceae bacterium]